MTRRTTVFLVLGLVVCAAVGLLCLLAPRWVTADESWQRAEQAMADHEFLRAQSYLVEYLVRWPQDARGHVLLARCYRQAEDEDLESAREHLKEAARLGGDNDELKLESALLDMQWHAGPPEVEQFLTSRMESQPADRPLILEALARGSLRQRRYNTANQWLDKWIHDDPDDWWPRMWRGVLFQHMSRPQLAIEDHQMVLRNRPKDPLSLKRLGVVLATSGFDYREAAQVLERYLNENSADADGLAALARCYRVLDRTDEAYALTERALASDSRHADALLIKALIELDRSEYSQALATLTTLQQASRLFDADIAQQRLMSLDPLLDNPHQTQRMEELLHLEAKALRGLGQDELAEQRLRQLAELQSDVRQLKLLLDQQADRKQDPQYLFDVAQLYLRIGLPRAAESWLQQMHAIAPDDPRIPVVMKEASQQISAAAKEAP
jgi:tetratricopeptide (TPR) repeat protein